MIRPAGTGSAADFIPARPTLTKLRQASTGCRGCDLWMDATQTVFGEGPARAPAVFVGEQPGDQEDRVGRPFVGPAGRLLDEALEFAGLDRGSVYLTNPSSISGSCVRNWSSGRSIEVRSSSRSGPVR
ncbi:hypothetical protein BH24GEM1_BH24GEM1_14090 [soil metagenome]